MQRIFVSEIPNTNAVISSRMTCGHCEVIQTVYSPVDGSYCAAAPRGSIEVGISRWLTSRCSTTTSGVGERLLGRVGVAARPVHDDVAGRVVVDLRRAVGDRRLDVDDHGERLPVDVDQLERVLGGLLRLGDDGRDARAGERDAVDLERARRDDEVLGPGGLPGARERVQVLEVLAGEDADDAGRGRGARGVDPADARVRVRRAQDRDVGHVRAASGRRGTAPRR